VAMTTTARSSVFGMVIDTPICFRAYLRLIMAIDGGEKHREVHMQDGRAFPVVEQP
jgi:hypothetical protein